MRKAILILCLLFCLETSAFATWSVVAIDRSTKRVVMAAASCVDTTDDAMKTAIAVVVPGVGVAACQAAADNTHQNQMLVFRELQKGTDPRQIIETRNFIRGLAGRRTVVMSSHILSEVEKVADRVAILLQGRLLSVEALADTPDLEALFLSLT